MSSSRRGGNSDDSILARMDRARGLSSRARTAWLAGAGGLIAVLIATIAWLAHTSMTTPHPLPVDGARTTLPPPGSFEMAHSEAPAQIINEPQRPDAGALPPLVMLQRAPVAASSGNGNGTGIANAAAPVPALAARMPAATPARLPAPPPARALAAAPHAVAPYVIAQPARAAAAPPHATAAPATSSTRGAQRVAAAKKAKPAAIAEAPEAAPVDLDIALISAVVASRHRAEQAACEQNGNCPPKP